MHGMILLCGIMIIIAVIVVLILYLPTLIKWHISQRKRDKQLDKVESIELGMSEDEMLDTMGGRYNKSLMWNGRVKYSWRFSNGRSYANKRSYRPNERVYSGIRKVDIYCSNGFVDEIRPYNL